MELKPRHVIENFRSSVLSVLSFCEHVFGQKARGWNQLHKAAL
jgi:hypothetical protein